MTTMRTMRALAPRAAAILILVTAIAAPAHAATQTAPASALDGTAWSVKVTPDEATLKKGEKAFDDMLVFQSGMVAMSECLKYGFKASKYTADKTAEGWAFRTEQASDREGTSVWTADIKGDAIKGTMVWTKQDGSVLTYAFSGRKGGK